jgi:prophage DNA circulation protein
LVAIRDIHNSWRDSLVEASFAGVMFHVETGTRQSGRRTVVHEYPKRNDPYSEDMGRSAVRYQITAYLLLGDRGLRVDLMRQRDDLIRALEKDDADILIHPSLAEYDAGGLLVMCERYSYSEQRERGGYLQFEMNFVEAGSPQSVALTDSKQELLDAADRASGDAAVQLKGDLEGIQ